MDGIARFTFESISRMVKDHPEHEFIYFFDREFDSSFITSDNITPIILKPQARHPILFNIWFDYSVTRALKKYKVDLFLSPDGFLSLRTKVPQLSVIHDLNFEHHPEDLPKHITKYYRTRFPKFARKSARIATVSEFSKEDIHNCYEIGLDMIDVVYNGVNNGFEVISEDEVSAVRNQWSSGCEYIVYVGSIHARKNVARLITAFDQYKKKSGSSVKMMIVGKKLWTDEAFGEAYETMAHKEDVIFTGRVSDEDLYNLVGASSLMAYVSYFEGFGIPILEAMNCGVPVLTSNITSMPEVAGGATELCDPYSIDSIEDGIANALIPTRNEELKTKGFERVKDFSWDRTADLLWKSVETLTNSGRS